MDGQDLEGLALGPGVNVKSALAERRAAIMRKGETAKSKNTSPHASKRELIREAELDLKERRRDDAAAAASREAARATRSSEETPKGGNIS